MKKIVMAIAFGMASFTAWAQGYATIEIETAEKVGPGSAIKAQAFYTPADGDIKPPAFHTWTITPCTEQGVITDEILFSETFTGAPDDVFEFPGSSDYQRGQFYRIDIYVANDHKELAASKGAVVEATASNGITGASSITVFPGESPAGGAHTLNLGTDTYFYTLASSGGSFVNAFSIGVNGIARSPSIPFNFTGPSGQLDISFSVPWTTTPCQDETFTISFFSVTSAHLFDFSYTVHCKTNYKQTVVYMGNDLYYKGDDNHIHKMTLSSGGWSYQAITPAGGWGSVEADGWLCGNPASSRIYFKGTDSKIYSLDNNGSSYTLAQTGTVANVKSDLHLRGNELIYIGNGNMIETLTYVNGVWTPFSIATANNYTAMSGIAYEDLPEGNIYFRDQNNAIKGLWLNGSNVWTIVPMPTTVGCNGDMIYDNGMKRVYYKGTDNYIHCTTWDASSSTWIYDAMTGNAQISANNSLAHLQGTNNIVFKGAGNRVYSTTKQSNGTWHTDWLEGSYSDVAGDLLEDWTHVWFVAQSKQLSNYYWNGSSWLVNSLNSSAPANTIGCSSYYRLASPQAGNEAAGNYALSVYPNPSNGVFQVNCAIAADHVQAELFNLVGEHIDQFSFSGTSYTYSPATTLAPGVYLLRITNEETITTKQLVIQ